MVQTTISAQSNFIRSYPLLFGKGIKILKFNLDEFVHDNNFFFKHSSSRREDYPFVEEVTEVAVRYAMQHTATQWLTMKYVAVRILQQWKNLKEYFLRFLPKKSIIISNLQWQIR